MSAEVPLMSDSVVAALDTMPAQRRAIAAGDDTEKTYQELTERVGVLAALSAGACPALVSPPGDPVDFTEAQWSVLHSHVSTCAVCAPPDPKRLRERVEWLVPGLVATPEDKERRWLTWLNAPKAEAQLVKPLQAVLRKASEVVGRINPALADPQVVKAVAAAVGLVLVGVVALVSSEAVRASALPPISQPAQPGATSMPPGAGPLTRSPVSASPTSGTTTPGAASGDPAQSSSGSTADGTARTARYNVKPPPKSTTPCVDDSRRMAPPPPDPAPGSINIDARPLVFRKFQVTGNTPSLDTASVQTVQLGPGTYPFQVASGVLAFNFTVTQAGLIDYPAELEGFLSGKGTRTLVVEGVVVTLDARRLSVGYGVLLANVPATNDDWILCKHVRMIPAPRYQVLQGSGHVVNFQFTVTPDGKISYDQAAFGSFVTGNGTSALEFLGHLVHVDARHAGGTGLLVHHVWGNQFSPSGEQTLYLLPTSRHSLQVVAGKVSGSSFTLHADGSVSIAENMRPFLALDQESGAQVIAVIRGPLP